MKPPFDGAYPMLVNASTGELVQWIHSVHCLISFMDGPLTDCVEWQTTCDDSCRAFQAKLDLECIEKYPDGSEFLLSRRCDACLAAFPPVVECLECEGRGWKDLQYEETTDVREHRGDPPYTVETKEVCPTCHGHSWVRKETKNAD